MALSFPRTGGILDEFFSPFFTPGFPDVTRKFSRALAPIEGGAGQLASRGVPVDVVGGLGGQQGAVWDELACGRGRGGGQAVAGGERSSAAAPAAPALSGSAWKGVWREVLPALAALPEAANLDGIKARYENGVLVLDVPKRELKKEEQAKRITVG
ncbi:heat-shock Hsp20 [Micractinium conductrix]|uniref:Heat-shock Hsp20 n=1 Tax=Micractinium conductrix TaxID=554055 RepID=A0A2P6V8P1_9CHLO|nr:heat-shock Hsp20 [Micractinium conductrix]|eukprot:PSC70448.1 heat-shock Hsp20 [Micractinium conductrix]